MKDAALLEAGGATSGDLSLFRTVFECSTEAILVVDPGHDRIISANPGACAKLRYPEQTLLTLPLSALHAEGQTARLRTLVQAVANCGQGRLDDFDCVTSTGRTLPVDIVASVIEVEGRDRLLLLLLHDLSEHRRDEHIFRVLAENTTALVGDDFFRALVKNLARVLEVDYAFVAEFTTVRTRVRTLAFWTPGGFVDNIEYDLAGTPCEAVLAGEIKHYPERVSVLFPRESRLGAESYLAIPLIDSGGEVLGHLAAVDTKPMPVAPRDLSIFHVFATRAAAELIGLQAKRQRQAAEQALRESEERLAGILASAMDAVIAFDDEHHVLLFNAAAEKVFHCSADWARGQPFDRFLSRPFRSLLKRYLQPLQSGDKGQLQLWAPEGLTAVRADGEEFPIEATLSAVRVCGNRLYTVILRDINERREAERTLRRLQLENRYLQEQLGAEHPFEDLIGDSPLMQALFDNLRKVAGGDTTVLLLGETGTGKELLARAVHELSPRKDKLLVKMNCAALPAELIESELFGHEKGAYTGATSQRRGRFELANGGTLFLDEVGELSPQAQAKLLRVLQEREFERVGGSQPIRVDVRVIAATNRDLAEMVKRGEFRADLYYRLNVFPLRVPPLRERREDIPALARHFLGTLQRRLGKSLAAIAPRSLARLQAYPWPGNVRELQNVIERAAILASGPLVEIDDALDMRLVAPVAAEQPLCGTLEDVERTYIAQVLATTRWVIEGEQGAAGILGMNPSTLRSRMQKLGIKRPGLAC